jgi:hypothetical protein
MAILVESLPGAMSDGRSVAANNRSPRKTARRFMIV